MAWHVDIEFDEDENRTRATARLLDSTMECRGDAYRHPRDAGEPIIGEEIAAARALIALGTELLHRAAGHIEASTHVAAHLVQ